MKMIPGLEGDIDERRKLPERRFTSRRKVFRGGKTFWPNGDSADCVVHNFSAAGAKLELVGSVPNRFDLLIEGDSIRRQCSVIWRKGNLVGVRFQITAELASAVGPAKKPIGSFKRYVEVCESLAQSASPSDRQILLEMAEAWRKAIRLLRAPQR